MKGTGVPLRRTWKKIKDGFVHLLHLDDSAHRIALGVAVGTFVAVTPTWGIQMLLVVGLAWLLRANKVAGLPMVWVTNPATNVPIYSFCYVVGRALVGGPGLDEIKEAMVSMSDPQLGWWALAKVWGDLMWHAAGPLWAGTCAVGLVAGAVLYVTMYYLIIFCRRHRRPAGAEPASDQAESGGAARP